MMLYERPFCKHMVDGIGTEPGNRRYVIMLYVYTYKKMFHMLYETANLGG